MFQRTMMRTTTQVFKTMSNRSVMAPKALVASSRFSTMLDKKEQAEETKYIRSIEQKRQEEIRKNLERILALEDSAKEKQDLHALLQEKKEEEKSFISKWGLDDWKFALPIGMLVVSPLAFSEVLIIDAEWQLTGCFILFASAMYTGVGPMIGKAFDDMVAEKEKESERLNAIVHQQIQDSVNANESLKSLGDDLKLLHSLKDQVAVAQAEVLTQLEESKYREAIVKKLETLSALEESAASAMRQRIVTSVKADVMKTFTSNKQVQENALNQAIAVLTSGSDGKLGKDVVGEVFLNSIKSYKENYAKQDPSKDPILQQLQHDVEQIVKPPEVASKGGNVYTL